LWRKNKNLKFKTSLRFVVIWPTFFTLRNNPESWSEKVKSLKLFVQYFNGFSWITNDWRRFFSNFDLIIDVQWDQWTCYQSVNAVE
jgi:hypothetical protein